MMRAGTLGQQTQRVGHRIGAIAHSLRHDGVGFLRLWPRVQLLVPGWLTTADARLLYALAHHGPARGAIVEIGSAWGKSTIMLAQGSKDRHREKVYAIDPHTGDPWFLSDGGISRHDSLSEFIKNIQLFDLTSQVIPVVAPSTDAAQRVDTGPIRLLFIDGLHTYEAVRDDIAQWVPRVVPGGIIVFDDYLNARDGVGVKQAVDELLASGLVVPTLKWSRWLCWTARRHSASSVRARVEDGLPVGAGVLDV